MIVYYLSCIISYMLSGKITEAMLEMSHVLSV